MSAKVVERALLSDDDDNNTANGEANLATPVNHVEVPVPSHDEVGDVIRRLKNNKAAGADRLSAELFKTGGDRLIGCMHQLICKIWQLESMHTD